MPIKDTKRFLLLLAGATLLGACGNKDAQPAGDQSARQIELPPAPAAQPALNDVARPEAPAAKPVPEKKKASAPRVPAPKTVTVRQLPQPAASAPVAPAPAPAAARTVQALGVITSGTVLTVSPVARVCSDRSKVGDRTTTTLASAVQGVDGAVLPMGSTVTLAVTMSQRGKGSSAEAKLAFDVVSVQVGDSTYAVTGHVAPPPLETTRAQSTGDQAKKVGVGAALGALAGQLFGKNTKSTVIGAAVGAAAGVAVASGTADWDVCVPAGAHIQVQLDRPLTVRIVTARP